MSAKAARRRALVIGASAGIGQAFAERLAADGYDLVVVARRRQRLEDLAARLRESGARVDVLVADLTVPAELREVEQRTSDLGMLVNNAGFGGYMPFVQLDPDRAEALILLQVVAATRLTRAALPGMVARKSGAIINVASMLAFSASIPSPPLPARATYASAKAYLVAFSELLAGELAGTGVRVQALCPGVVRTEFHALMGMDPDRMPIPPMPAAELVQASLAGLALGEAITLPAVADTQVLTDYQKACGATFDSGRPNKLATRYQQSQPTGATAHIS